jgi:hypothetical protein
MVKLILDYKGFLRGSVIRVPEGEARALVELGAAVEVAALPPAERRG